MNGNAFSFLWPLMLLEITSVSQKIIITGIGKGTMNGSFVHVDDSINLIFNPGIFVGA